jgi:hypothetical protein
MINMKIDLTKINIGIKVHIQEEWIIEVENRVWTEIITEETEEEQFHVKEVVITMAKYIGMTATRRVLVVGCAPVINPWFYMEKNLSWQWFLSLAFWTPVIDHY